VLPEAYAEVKAGPNHWRIFSHAYHVFELSGRFALNSTPGLGLYAKGIADATHALSQFDTAVANCQATYGYPNVP
jgi:hypothetical protein